MYGLPLLRIAVAAPLLVLPACGDDDEPAAPAATSFSATLSGANEVPPVPTTATGSATLTLTGDQIDYTINVTDLQNAVVSHIHIAPEGENGPVRMNLCGTGDPEPPCTSGTGVLATGTNGTTVGSPAITFDSLVSAMRTGGAYVNVHTDDGQGDPNTGPGDMASGEIRGQVVAN
ncbi:MAG: CHRD domain-containing protein [Gemmatimonadales bacterium]